jgi:hypothetical protein
MFAGLFFQLWALFAVFSRILGAGLVVVEVASRSAAFCCLLVRRRRGFGNGVFSVFCFGRTDAVSCALRLDAPCGASRGWFWLRRASR